MTQVDHGLTKAERVAFSVNGTPVTVRSDHPHLLAALREELNITSAKDGCSPTGQCGCCTVLVDGKAIVSCQQSLEKVTGSEITTLEESANQNVMLSLMRSRLAVVCNVDFAFPESSCAPKHKLTKRCGFET